MNFSDYLQSKYMEAQQDVKNVYSVTKHAELLATEDLRNTQRFFYKVMHFIILPFKYVLTKLNLLKAPKTMEEHLEALKASLTIPTPPIQTPSPKPPVEPLNLQHEVVLTDEDFVATHSQELDSKKQ